MTEELTWEQIKNCNIIFMAFGCRNHNQSINSIEKRL